jgi:hypothetical protein
MRFKQVASIAAMTLLLSAGAVSASDDGTGGPEMATPNPEGCNRELVTAEVFEQFEQPDGGMFSGSIESVVLADIQALEPADAETTQAIDETLRAYGACISRYGPIGAYAFLVPDIGYVEMVYLGVSGVTLADATPLAEGEAGTIVPASSLTPESVVMLGEGRVGALLPSPQPGSEYALLTFVEIDGVWMIEAVAPVVEDAVTDTGGGGGP